MANPRMMLLDLLSKAEQGEDKQLLRDGIKLLAQELMDTEVTQQVGAGMHERVDSRLTYRNGYRDREWDTRVGTIDLQIPKLRMGTYFPSQLSPRRQYERALVSVVQEAYIHGVSTRSVDPLADALGLKGISKDQVSRICKELDSQVTAFRTRRFRAAPESQSCCASQRDVLRPEDFLSYPAFRNRWISSLNRHAVPALGGGIHTPGRPRLDEQ